MGTDAADAQRGRYRALDGLRGVAAFVVLGYHGLLLTPAVSALYVPGGEPPEPGSLLWWLTFSPLKLFSSGPQAVILFFVLSGFVLALPVFRPGFDWLAYFPRRFVRLMLPVTGAVALSAVLILTIPQSPNPAFSSWMNASVTPTFAWPQAVGALNLFNGDTHIVNPLWSIQWEMIFSFTLPVFALVAVLVRRWWLGGVALAVAAAAIGSSGGVSALMYLPVFLIGVLMAAGVERMHGAVDAVNGSRARALIWSSAVGFAVFLIVGPWILGDDPGYAWLRSSVGALVPLGSAILVFCAFGSRLLGGILRLAPFQFAGRISFSLYLVHAPILIAVRSAWPGMSVYSVIGVAIAVSIVVASAFYVAVEAPAHRLSKWAGDWGGRVLRTPDARGPRIAMADPESHSPRPYTRSSD